jgi:hypothetical protein
MTNVAAQISVPLSVGEFIDKITILRIKQQMIRDAEKVKNVSKELESLEGVAASAGIDLKLPEVEELQGINMTLWKIEDDIREKERAREFDDRFIELARSVYVTNDERFRVKSAINTKLGSEFKEEKSYEAY